MRIYIFYMHIRMRLWMRATKLTGGKLSRCIQYPEKVEEDCQARVAPAKLHVEGRISYACKGQKCRICSHKMTVCPAVYVHDKTVNQTFKYGLVGGSGIGRLAKL